MMEKEFLAKMSDLMDYEDELSLASNLEDIEEWDSLSYVSFIAMAKASYSKKIDAKMVKEAKTIGDLYNMVK